MGVTPRLLLVLTAVLACCAAALPSSAAAATTTTTKTQYFKNACGGSITPSTQTVDKSTGAKANFVVTLLANVDGASTAGGAYRDCDPGAGKTKPAVGVEVKWEVTSGPCAGKSGTGTTGADGKYYFSLDGCGCGVDELKISVKKVVTAVTTTTTTTTTNVCKTWLLFICIEWETQTSTSVSTSTITRDIYWYTDTGSYKAIWIGCTPPPTGPTGPPPTGPTGPPPTGPTGPPPTGPTGPPPTGPTGPTYSTPTPPTVDVKAVDPSAVVALNKNCTRPYILIKPTVSGGTARSMVIYVDNKRVGSVKATATKANLQYKLYTSKFSPKSHRVKVVIRFTNGSASTITKKFKPCARFSAVGRAAPRFTG